MSLLRRTIQVSNTSLVDNRGRQGLFTGSLDETTRQAHGVGRMEYTDNEAIESYEGRWVSGDWSGFGKVIYKESGDAYEGGFLDNMKHGVGILTFRDGRVYDGAFQFNKIGKGKMLFLDGSTYWGYFSADDEPHGRGKLTYADGSVYDGEFEHGSIQGHGRMTLPDGRWYLGEWSEGKKNGVGVEVTADGILVHEGVFCNNLPVTCSSFPQRRKSTGRCIVYRTSSSGSKRALVGPLPRQLSMPKIFASRLVQQ